tara:strand:- start:454 stop:891 length:438 start_codon:yes stop_codon:yes gene_type:complete
MKTKIQSGKVGLTLDEPFTGMLQKILDRIAPNAEKIIRQNIGDLTTKAAEEWPVKTGKSAGSFTNDFGFFAGRGKLLLTGTIRNTAPYSYLIRSGRDIVSKNSSGSKLKVSPGKNVWVELVREPLKELAPAISAAITKELATLGD